MKRILYIVLVLLTVSLTAQAQYDYLSAEAYINDHKVHEALLLARTSLEATNEELHNSSKNEVLKYKSINSELDKLTRAFDVIELLYNSLKTGLNIYSTLKEVKSCVTDYSNLLTEFHAKIISRGYISVKDTMVIVIGYRACENIYEDSKQLYNSVEDLLLYCTGAAACSTAQLLSIIKDINTSLDLIAYHLRLSYLQTYKYIQIRIGYWKESVNTVQSKQAIATAAFSRWRNASTTDTNKDSSDNVTGDHTWTEGYETTDD